MFHLWWLSFHFEDRIECLAFGSLCVVVLRVLESRENVEHTYLGQVRVRMRVRVRVQEWKQYANQFGR
jgi:hypothetical protein